MPSKLDLATAIHHFFLKKQVESTWEERHWVGTLQGTGNRLLQIIPTYNNTASNSHLFVARGCFLITANDVVRGWFCIFLFLKKKQSPGGLVVWDFVTKMGAH